MNGFFIDIEELTLSNDNYRKVICTGKHAQLVVMSLLPVVMNGKTHLLKTGSAVVVPVGTWDIIESGAPFDAPSLSSLL